MKKLNLPTFNIKLKSQDDRIMIFDVVRKKWLLNTPEEWVRQHFVHFLNQEYNYPLSLIEIEKSFQLNGLLKRADIIVNDLYGKAVILVECKAPEININQKTFDQIARYNMALNVPILAVTNGLNHIVCQMDSENSNYSFLRDLPKFNHS